MAAREGNKELATHLGMLTNFWRYSAVLGPGLENGGGLKTIPDLWQQGDFPYHKRPYEKESLFADHLSVVRLLGGYRLEQDPKQDRDLVYRDSSGALKYHWELLRARLAPYLETGYSNLTLVLDEIK